MRRGTIGEHFYQLDKTFFPEFDIVEILSICLFVFKRETELRLIEEK